MDAGRQRLRLENINQAFNELKGWQISPEANWNAARETVTQWFQGQTAILHQMMLIFFDIMADVEDGTPETEEADRVAPTLVKEGEGGDGEPAVTPEDKGGVTEPGAEGKDTKSPGEGRGTT